MPPQRETASALFAQDEYGDTAAKSVVYKQGCRRQHEPSARMASEFLIGNQRSLSGLSRVNSSQAPLSGAASAVSEVGGPVQV